MNRFLDVAKLGGSLLAAGPVLLQLGGSRLTWWIGLGFTVIGPVLMCVRKAK